MSLHYTFRVEADRDGTGFVSERVNFDTYQNAEEYILSLYEKEARLHAEYRIVKIYYLRPKVLNC